jgi:hypothetical protein
MKSPFPGMDPYLERSWRDVHTQLITSGQAALNGTLPEDLVARVEERVVVDSVDYEHPRAIYPDVRVYKDPNHSFTQGAAGQQSAVAEPIVLEFQSEEHTEAFITILDVHGNELVTVIEFLSPSNKLPGFARDQYRRKREELVASKINIVEVDLVRAGRWRELLMPTIAPARLESVYRVVTRRVHPKARVELYLISLRDRLPLIPVPLREGEKDVVLDLQPLVDQAYVNGRYDRTRYDVPCDPPLEPEDAVWAEALLRAAGRR